MPKKIFSHGFSLRTLKRGLIDLWPVFLLIIFSLILSFLNYQPGTTLTGWDNLHPEFHFDLNLKNSLFSVWQEKGPGFLAGMSPAADLPRILILLSLNKLGVGISSLRYLWTFASLSLGPLGLYFLLHHVFLKPKFDPQTKRIASFLGGLFYLLNLATVQYFFIPFESFVTFFAVFPWLILAITLFLEKSSLRRYLFLLAIATLSAPAYFVQTIFVVTLLCLIPFFFGHFPHRKRRIVVVLATLFLTQAYWLLPQIFFVLTHAGEVSQSHVNLLSSPETLYRNLALASLRNLTLLKGYWFNILDPVGEGKFDYLFLVWRNHLGSPTIQALGYLFFALVLTGIIYSLKKNLPYTKAFLAILLISSFFLLGGVTLVGTGIPLLGELFRSPFTKFSLPLAASFAVFFSVGVIFLLDLFSFLHSRLTYLLTLFTVTTGLIIFATPAFTGNLISPLMRVRIPTVYSELFDFFRNEDQATRVANFPQYQIWGWNYYKWGYRGAGFLWYGIRQPILDRGFDVWEKNSERYYEEVSTAIGSENQEEFEKIIDKYAINWILIDKNVIIPNPNQDNGLEKIQKFIDNSGKFTLAKNFDDEILVYKTDVDKRVKNFLSVSPNSQLSILNSPFDIPLRPHYPRSLSDKQITLSAKMPAGKVTIPSLSETEDLLPTAISYRKTTTGVQFRFEPILPRLTLGDRPLDIASSPTTADFPLERSVSGIILGVNDTYVEVQLPDELTDQSAFYPLTNLYLPSKKAITLSLYSNTPLLRLDLTTPLGGATPRQCYTDKPNRKIEKIVEGKTISLVGTDLVGCLSAPIPPANTLNQLLSLEFTYSSATGTPGNANITDTSLGGAVSPQPLLAKKTPSFARIFVKSRLVPLQANLILEANEVKSTQEINYTNVNVSYLPLLGETNLSLPVVPPLSLSNQKDAVLSVTIPIIDSPLTLTSSPEKNLMNSEARNCDNFNQGKVSRQTTTDGFLYTAENANSCDQINLKHLPHNLNYAIIAEVENQKGLPPTICLENHSTRRCDVFERLIDGPQLIIQPIANPNESAGYTLHLFNESFGNRETRNLIKSLTITPLPQQFLKNIVVSNQPSAISNSQISNSSHPAEFLYTLTTTNDQAVSLNLYQTKSPYWTALEVSEVDLKLPTWKLILKLPFLYLTSNRLAMNRAEGSGSWHNSWDLPACPPKCEAFGVVISYLPQYLEFLGFLLLPFPLIGSVIHFLRKKLRRR